MYIRFLFLFCLIRIQANKTFGQISFLDRDFIYNNTYHYGVIYNLSLSATTQQIMDFVEDDESLSRYPSRVYFKCAGVNSQLPLSITAIQQEGAVSWKLPGYEFENSVYYMARTLCPRDALAFNVSQARPTLQFFTFNTGDVSVSVKVQRVQDFFIEIDKEINVSVTPDTPKYYYFSLANASNWNIESPYKLNRFLNFNYTLPKNVMLMIDSDDELCALVSIQNYSCPVFDTEHEILHEGSRFTMTKRGGITLMQSTFPHGFYIVLIVKKNDADCGRQTDIQHNKERIKNFRIKITTTISYEEFVIAVLTPLLLVITFFGLVTIFACCSCIHEEEERLAEDIITPTTSDVNSESEQTDNTAEEIDSAPRDNLESPTVYLLTSSGPPPVLTVDFLSRRGSRSRKYLWSLLTVTIVYVLPVVQLLGTYQNMVYETGDQDLCYYNFLCAHPLGLLSDFNHVFSNLGYVVLGLLFMIQVWMRQRHYNRLSPSLQGLGIPPHFGLLHGLGAALIAEGLLSACYHLCPNQMNFQFDSSFMYVTAILSMIKLYQNRHPDVNARAHHTFTLVAFVFALGLLGTLWPSVTFWVGFTIFHLLSCLLLTINIYYLGNFRLEQGTLRTAWIKICNMCSNLQELVPRYRARAVSLAIANIANWALATFGVVVHNTDFATHLLYILMVNTILYTYFYVCMKHLNHERMYKHTWLYFISANLVGFGAFYCFFNFKTKWSLTPAASRVYNAPCTVLWFYDSHDLWHFASAAAMFLCYNLLLTIDDPLHLTPRNNIPVF